MNDSPIIPDQNTRIPKREDKNRFRKWLRARKRMKNIKDITKKSSQPSLKTFEKFLGNGSREQIAPVQNSAHDRQEKTLISNVLEFTKLCAIDVMVPRADIIAIDIDATHHDIIALLGKHPRNRIPVYRETLDDIAGCITVKDVLACLAEGKTIKIPEIMREVLIVSPSIAVLDLLREMRNGKKHIAMVVDEYGGIDGLVTVGDLIEAIVGEFNDEQNSDTPRFIERADGSVVADARVDIEEFEDRFGSILSDDEREDIDTLGGFAMAVAGYLPTRGEVLIHEQTGMEIEILDADPRRVKRLRINKIPKKI